MIVRTIVAYANRSRVSSLTRVSLDSEFEHMAVKTAGVLPDLPAAEKIAIIETELDRLEKKIYQAALELQAARQKGKGGNAPAMAQRIDELTGTKESYIQELERVRSMVVG